MQCSPFWKRLRSCQFLSLSLYLVSCIQFPFAGVLMFPQLSNTAYFVGVLIYLESCTILLLVGTIDTVVIGADLVKVVCSRWSETTLSMKGMGDTFEGENGTEPRNNEVAVVNDKNEKEDATSSTTSVWRTAGFLIIACLYALGGFFFATGSLIFLPYFGDSSLGVLLFNIGCICYISGCLVGTGEWCISTWISLKPFASFRGLLRRAGTLEGAISLLTFATFGLGCSLFIVGGELDDKGYSTYGALLWTVGGFLFVLGAIAPFVLYIFESKVAVNELRVVVAASSKNEVIASYKAICVNV